MPSKFFTYFFLLITANVFAQNDIDALRYSQLTFGGTARFNSMAGSMGALGGDISTLSFNPAGVAIMRKSDFNFSPSFFSQSSESNYNNRLGNDGKFNFNFGNIGVVFSGGQSEDPNKVGWAGFNFGIAYNRTNNFHARHSILGNNNSSSLLDVMASSANGKSPDELDQFSELLAFNTYLIDTIPGEINQYESAIPSGTLINQIKTIETAGSMGETVISFAGNYSNRLYLGASIGFPTIKYREESSYVESDLNDSIPNFLNSYSYNSSLYTKGSGFNFKMGAIYRATDWMRFGAAFHTPTYFTMEDTYNNALNIKYDDGTDYTETSPDGDYKYNLVTPMRAMGSFAFILKKKASINVDYEYVDYSNASLRSSPNVFVDVNNTIRQKYISGSNIRVGGEFKTGPFSVRGGYALYGNPFKSSSVDASRASYTAGLGMRDNNYYLDFAFVLTQYKEQYYLYDPSFVKPATIINHQASFIFTLGFRF